MKQLNIAIASQPGTGKTTVAQIIYEALKKEGFQVELKDTRGKGDDNLVQTFGTRKESIKKTVSIKIITAQTTRQQLI